MRKAIRCLKLCAIILGLSVGTAQGADFTDGTATFSGYFSREAVYGVADFMMPLFESPNNAAFFVNPGAGVNLKIKDGMHGAERAYMGIGHRVFLPGGQFGGSGPFHKGVILGLNWYLDGQYSMYDNILFDTGGGLEMLSDRLDARLNVYFRLTDEKEAGKNISGRGLYGAAVHSDSSGAYETALGGADGELGYRLPLPDQLGEIWVFGGAYRLQGKRIENISGLKGRVQWNPLPSIHIGAGLFSTERFNGERWQIQLAYHIPISVNAMKGGGGLFRMDNTPKTGDLWRDRFTTPVLRHGM
ncbi:MAG: inverse autotransporter beta domain-containing protein [Desulfovibrionaceae bacterium]|nr:inverse autotransporter beta domain-containing protein [Desulfovibrionaceae bacterium]